MIGNIVRLPSGTVGIVVGYWSGDDVVQVKRADGYHEALHRGRLRGIEDASTKQTYADGAVCVNCN